MDNRKNYSKNKILIIEMYFIFQQHAINTLSYKLGINKIQLQRVVSEWQDNNGFITVESVMNLKN